MLGAALNHPVISSLLPVVLLIAVGFLAGKRGWIGSGAVKDLSNLVFVVLAPALLFRAMSTVRVEQLDFRPLASYFIGAGLIFAGAFALMGFNRRAAVLALAGTYGNTVMIGIPLVGLAFGPPGLVTLFTLVSVHALVLLTLATILLELALLREEGGGAAGGQAMGRTVLLAARNAIVHPVFLPILAGLLFAQTGLAVPPVLDKPLQMLGNAFGPLSLVLVGATLAVSTVGEQLAGALRISLVKNVLHPLLVFAAGWALGAEGAPLAVMVIAAAMPVGANVFLFSQRYKVAQELVTASVGVSTALGLVTVSVVLALVG